MTERTHSIIQNNKRCIWVVKRLWQLSQNLTPFDYTIAEFKGLDEDCWYGDVNVPTVRSILEHIQRIEAADLSYPIILSETGVVMDGLHRICKASLLGQTTIRAVQFSKNPPPDTVEPHKTPL